MLKRFHYFSQIPLEQHFLYASGYRSEYRPGRPCLTPVIAREAVFQRDLVLSLLFKERQNVRDA